ncbi:MAG: hypothetical protein K0R44_3035, partial [Thermomicrobiales bacterium]|nr:hypothetical protein [Thermomicrobiales bacterium]
TCAWCRPAGTWAWRITLEDGRHLTAHGKTRVQAKATWPANAYAASLPIDVKASRQSLGQFLERWLADVVQPKLAPTTYGSCRDTLRNYILPTLGSNRVGKRIS